jgi:hypothetical protein
MDAEGEIVRGMKRDLSWLKPPVAWTDIPLAGFKFEQQLVLDLRINVQYGHIVYINKQSMFMSEFRFYYYSVAEK